MKTGNQPLAMHLAPRCLAKGKRNGKPCQAPAMENGRCRLHGGKSPGPPTGNQNALKHGLHAKLAMTQRHRINQLVKESRALLREMNKR